MRLFLSSLCLLASALVSGASAGPTLLFEADTGKVLYSENMDDQWHPASLTKIMTAYIAFKDIKAGRVTLETDIECTELAYKEPPSKVGLPVGAKLKMDTALKALIIKSANDVAVMIAEALGPTHDRFIARMNETAGKLGMTRTHFANPNGLPDKAQVTTARDLAKLSRAIVTEFPEHAHYWSMPGFQLGKLHLSSHNGLLKTFEGADGLKTGFICDSGYNVVASATRDGRQIMAVVLGEPSGADRTVRAASLLEHGFRQWGWKQLFNTDTIDNLPLDEGARDARSVRHTVTSWSCGNRKTARRLRAAKERVKRRHVQKGKKKKTSAENAKPAKPAAAN
ncbi:MAG: D-alanyl-D-alanine carboxypeptidase [Alphaproteobacteria bacterium]|nr:D-alanyl-D-alanine carboxypeptidase [Alphaproteobacteria bacterium]